MCGLDLSSVFELGSYIALFFAAICFTYGFSWVIKKCYELFTR